MDDEVKKIIKQFKTWNWIMFCMVLVTMSVSIGHNIVKEKKTERKICEFREWETRMKEANAPSKAYGAYGETSAERKLSAIDDRLLDIYLELNEINCKL